MSQTQEKGIWGEVQVQAYLEQQGFHTLARRFRSPYGEIDLIVENETFLCFVEVKLRKRDTFATAREAVTPSKQKKIILTAEMYLLEYPTEKQPRFDVAEVYAPQGTQTRMPRIVYWDNAFC